MELKRAFEILSALADGHNPFTGEVFESESIFQNPETIRALYAATEALCSRMESGERRRNLPDNAGKSWSDEEVDQLIKEFDQGIDIKEIAEKHARTRGAVTSRLIKLGKIQYNNDRDNPEGRP